MHSVQTASPLEIPKPTKEGKLHVRTVPWVVMPVVAVQEAVWDAAFGMKVLIQALEGWGAVGWDTMNLKALNQKLDPKHYEVSEYNLKYFPTKRACVSP